jgi:phospholipid/cholesterol/gamma-HCH transport system ATP-binding protein
MAQEKEKEPSDPIISVKNVTVGYGSEVILRNVSFNVMQGEVLAILGRSGCGKSTLLRAMIGLLEPERGEVLIAGERMKSVIDGSSSPILRSIGVLFQSGALFSSMTVAENVALPLRQYTDLSDGTIEKLVVLKLHEVGLAGKERMLPSELSGGMQKRAALARAMALDPKILFFDEPSAGLDPVTSAELDRTIVKINETFGTTIVIVTHELASINAVAHRAVMVSREEKGLIADGSLEDLRDRSDDPRVRGFFGRTPSEN